MAEPKAVVRNAASSKQVAQGRETEQFAKQRLDRAFAAVLATADGLLVLDHVIGMGGPYHSIFDTHNSRMSWLAGRQDLAHELITLCEGADPQALIRMMQMKIRAEAEKVEPAPRTDAPDGDT